MLNKKIKVLALCALFITINTKCEWRQTLLGCQRRARLTRKTAERVICTPKCRRRTKKVALTSAAVAASPGILCAAATFVRDGILYLLQDSSPEL